jgi:hypothetical protein
MKKHSLDTITVKGQKQVGRSGEGYQLNPRPNQRNQAQSSRGIPR